MRARKQNLRSNGYSSFVVDGRLHLSPRKNRHPGQSSLLSMPEQIQHVGQAYKLVSHSSLLQPPAASILESLSISQFPPQWQPLPAFRLLPCTSNSLYPFSTGARHSLTDLGDFVCREGGGLIPADRCSWLSNSKETDLICLRGDARRTGGWRWRWGCGIFGFGRGPSRSISYGICRYRGRSRDSTGCRVMP